MSPRVWKWDVLFFGIGALFLFGIAAFFLVSAALAGREGYGGALILLAVGTAFGLVVVATLDRMRRGGRAPGPEQDEEL